MNKEIANLIKTLTALGNIILIYLFVTWTYAGLQFVIGSFTG